MKFTRPNAINLSDRCCNNTTPGSPEYSYEEIQETELEYGSEIELTCTGVGAGENPGPTPVIKYSIHFQPLFSLWKIILIIISIFATKPKI